MKRSPMPARRKPLKRTALATAKAKHPAARSTLAPQSKKRRAENRARASWQIDRCELAGMSPCSGPLDLHELVRRAGAPGGRTDRRLVIGLCREHHRLDESAVYGWALGIRIPSHDWTRCAGDPVLEQELLDAAAARRAEATRNGGPR